MIISLCGDKKDKEIIINDLKEIYGDKILVCNYFKLYFNTYIKEEKKKYDLAQKYNSKVANQMFKKHINKIVTIKMKRILNSKNKIIILISDNVLTRDINKTHYFNISDLKILITSEENFNLNSSSPFSHKNLYNKNDFDIILDKNDKIDVKKLVKL